MFTTYIKHIIPQPILIAEGGAATKGSPMSKEYIKTLFDIIKNKFFRPMNIIIEDQDFVKIGSWSSIHDFDDTKMFGDIDILINLKDKSFEELSELSKVLYNNYVTQYPNKEIEFPEIKINKGTKVVSFALPFDNDTKFGQIDFFFTDVFNAVKLGYAHTEHAQIKGKFKSVALNNLIRLVDDNYRWSPMKGLKISDTEYVSDLNQINELLGFDITTMTSFTAVWNKIKELVKDAEQLEKIKIDLRKLAGDDIQQQQQFEKMVK